MLLGKSSPQRRFIRLSGAMRNPERVSHGACDRYMAKIFKHRTDVAYFDYKDFKTLQRYVNQFGQIEQRKKTGLTESQQRQLARAIKRARHLALMPFVANS